MSNTQNTDHFNQLLSDANSSTDSAIALLIGEMVTYSRVLESAIDDEADEYDFTVIKSPELKSRIEQLNSSILEELGALLFDFLTYIVTFEKVLYFSVESFQRSSSLTSSDAENVVDNMRKKGKSKIPPAASLPPRPRPDESQEISLSQIQSSLNQFSNEFAPEFLTFLTSYMELLEVLEYLDTFLQSNRPAIDSRNLPTLNKLTYDIVIYTMSLLPQAPGLNTPQIFDNQLSVTFNSTLTGLQNEIDPQLYSEFQSFLNYIETLEDSGN